MSGAPRIRLVNVADTDARPVLGPGGNKAHSLIHERKSISRPLKKAEKSTEETVEVEDKNGISSRTILAKPSPPLNSVRVPSIFHRHESLLHCNLSLNASCSSDASTDSVLSRASTGRIYRTSSSTFSRKKPSVSKRSAGAMNGITETLPPGGLPAKRRCAWVTASTGDPSYITFHDEEWGVPAHDDKKLFEFLVLSGALSELTWPIILSKRCIFREVFSDFDPIAVSKLNEKKITAPGSPASSLLSELKLRSIIENACQVSKVIEEFGSFDKYIWSFVNYKPIVSSYRYPRQIPVKTPKADLISKDLVRRGFRSVGPTVVYSFMQVAGITNDHLISCFRFKDSDCERDKFETKNGGNSINCSLHEARVNSEIASEICVSIEELSNFSLE